jgi:hypothetical protein
MLTIEQAQDRAAALVERVRKAGSGWASWRTSNAARASTLACGCSVGGAQPRSDRQI